MEQNIQHFPNLIGTAWFKSRYILPNRIEKAHAWHFLQKNYLALPGGNGDSVSSSHQQIQEQNSCSCVDTFSLPSCRVTQGKSLLITHRTFWDVRSFQSKCPSMNDCKLSLNSVCWSSLQDTQWFGYHRSSGVSFFYLHWTLQSSPAGASLTVAQCKHTHR